MIASTPSTASGRPIGGTPLQVARRTALRRALVTTVSLGRPSEHLKKRSHDRCQGPTAGSQIELAESGTR